MKELQVIDSMSSIGNIEAYCARANQIPMLSEAEELELARRWYEHQDVEAARRLVLSHLRFVARVARNYSGYGLAIADLIQEGNIGLMKAIRRFNPNVGVRLVSFAVHWIKAEMHEFILKNWRIVKVATTKAQRKLFFNIRSSKKRLGWFNQEEIEGVAKDLGVSTKDVVEMEMRMSAHDVAYDLGGDDSDDSDNAAFSPDQYLEDNRYEPSGLLETDNWNSQVNEKLQQALTLLDDRGRDIVQRRWLAEKKATLHDLAAQYSISAERVRQLEQAAMKKLKGALEQDL